MAGSAAEAPTTPDVQPPDVPDQNAPENSAPENSAPENSAPENSAPERGAVESSAPGSGVFESGAAANRAGGASADGASADGASADGASADGASGAAGGTGLRASDAERDAAVGELREHFAAGRLSQDTFMYRMNKALGARDRSDLPPLLADLPGRQGPLGWLSAGWAGSLVHRVLGALSGQGHRGGPGDGGVLSPRRGLTTGFQAAPGSPPVIRPASGQSAPIALPFPRGAQAMFTIGRDRGCDLAIDDLTVSRVHARLQRTDDGWRLFDLGSTNGTRVNGWRVRGGVDVRAGDLVRFGDAEYAFGDSRWS